MPYKDKQKQRAYQNQWAKQRRLDWLEDRSCMQCGSTQDLEVDHIDPSTKFTHRIWTYAAQRRVEELAKCQALCSTCHLEKTRKENQRPLIHGTPQGYQRGCRCRICKEAHAAAHRLQLHRQPAYRRALRQAA